MRRLLRAFLDFPDPVVAVLLVAGVMLVLWLLTRGAS